MFTYLSVYRISGRPQDGAVTVRNDRQELRRDLRMRSTGYNPVSWHSIGSHGYTSILPYTVKSGDHVIKRSPAII
ncbi:hypothetical protein AMELA_G00252580 [Ameiurus melas]|uniref:Uncharacterized protein n=1 Tax=Ameiurus melas TaxID=219545 RepID=A0A7J5ZQX8_AMEME|nr:hypothetical protein AMELA_G00252580 [Ameiurus melas]